VVGLQFSTSISKVTALAKEKMICFHKLRIDGLSQVKEVKYRSDGQGSPFTIQPMCLPSLTLANEVTVLELTFGE